MGRTARFEQIYVASLEADPVEQETLTGVKSILTREIEANEIVLVPTDEYKGRIGIANTAPTKSFSVGSALFIDETDTIVFDLKERGRASRFFVENQLAVGTTNPTKAFQVDSGGSTKVSIDVTGRDLMTVSGNLVASNLIVSDRFTTSGSNLSIKETNSNVITIIGGIETSNLSVGSNVGIYGEGSNVMKINGNVYHNGYLNLVGNIAVKGNITVTETATYIATQDLRVSNVIIHAGFGNGALSRETAIVMSPGTGYSNVAMGFVGGARGREMAFFQTDAYGGWTSEQITVDDTKVVNVHVYGDIYTANNIGANNTYPTHDLCVGSNVFIDDRGSNVIYASGNIYATGVRIGTGGLRVGSLLTMAPGTETPAIISGNVQMNAIRTTGTAPSGISNTAPTDTLAIGTKVFANMTALNALTILGNTATTNLTTELVFSSSNVVIHADRFGGDTTSNVLILMAGPTASNVSAIEVYGASTSNTHQNIRFKTKNTERLRITSNGLVGINTTNPTERLVVAGNVYVTGSNTVTVGNIWGSTGNISMRAYTMPNVGETKIENIVASGKGLNIYASTTPTMSTPKVTILESSNVGIGTAAPVGRLHTTGGSVFINDQPTYRNSYNHLDSPLTVTNTTPIVDTTDSGTVLHLAREGNATRDGVRATFKLGKFDNTSGKSKSKLDIYLADDRYTDDQQVFTIQADGRVGIGTTQPSAHLEVYCTGIANPRTNGILVHNHESPSGDAIVAMQTDINTGNAFTSYIQSDGDVDPTGWSVGVSGSNDFRITQNPDRVYDTGAIGVYINGTSRHVGVGTDSPRDTLEVNGNLVIGQQLTFSGTNNDTLGNTFIRERIYDTDFNKSEMLIFKGDDGGGDVSEGPDRIHYLAPQHLFKTYTTSGVPVDPDDLVNTNIAMSIAPSGIVVVGGTDAAVVGVNTKLKVNGDIEFAGGGTFKLAGLEFLTSSGTPSRNIIRNKADSTVARPLTFTHKYGEDADIEFARFNASGNLGLGTTTPSSNIHVYDTTSGNIDLLKLQSGGANKETGMIIYTDDGEGGYVRGFSNSTNGTTGLVMGVANNSTQTNCIHLLHTSNVGIGTNKPATKLHVYNGVPRVESSSSNALIEFKTSGGTSNIYSDTTGNVYISPSSLDATVVFKGDTTVEGDLAVGGAIDFGSQVAIDLGGASANTALHVGGGLITNSNQVACKRYAQTFQIGEGLAKDIQLMFGTGAFYAKVTAILRRTDGSTVRDLSTMILELQGGTSNDTASTLDIAVGTKNLFGGTNSYPWSPTVTTGIRGISITPYNVDSTRIYNYDIFVELMSACNGKLVKISRDLSSPADLDTATGGQTQIVAFTY